MRNLVRYLKDDSVPALVQAGVAHAQFETIHPFLDGNGRLGRLLVALILARREALSRPLLYISVFLAQHKPDYYQWLTRVREEGDWEGWLNFFFEGVEQAAMEACRAARSLVKIQQDSREAIRARYPGRRSIHELQELLFQHPIVTVKRVAEALNVDVATANTAVADMCAMGVL